MYSKLLKLGVFLTLALVMVVAVGCSKSNPDGASSPTAPQTLSLDTELTPVESLGLSGKSFAQSHGDSDSDRDGDSDQDGDSDEDSDLDSDEDSDQDSDLDSDGDSDSDLDSDGDSDGCDNSGPGSLNRGPGNCEDDGSDDDAFSDSGFQGRVTGIGADGSSLELANGLIVRTGVNTFWQPDGDLFSLFDVESALASGERVRVEGDGRMRADGTVRARSIKAESDGRGGVGDDFEGFADEFRGRVDATDTGTRSLILRNGAVVVVRGADWDPFGDLTSFRQVNQAVSGGATVRVEGFGTLEADGTIRAQSIKAETRGDGGIGNDEFAAAVTGADAFGGLLFLANGVTLVVDGATAWDPLGDLFTLESTAAAVAMGRPVRAEGQGALQADGTVLALTLKVEVDD